MSETSLARIDYYHPRTIWVLGLQLFYTMLAMIPVYYYLKEILEIRADGRSFMIFLPIGIAILLFLIQLKLNLYFWFAEKIHKRRDIFFVSLKSLLMILSMFYVFYLLIFGYWLNDTETYQRVEYKSELSQIMAEVLLSISLIYFILTMMINIQNQRFERIFKRKFARRS